MASNYEKKLPPVMENGLSRFFEVISGKWKALLLFHIETGATRPGQLQKVILDADRRVLDQQLNELIADGLISKKIVEQKPLHVEYDLTDIGRSILPVLCKINDWGEFYNIENERKGQPKG